MRSLCFHVILALASFLVASCQDCFEDSVGEGTSFLQTEAVLVKAPRRKSNFAKAFHQQRVARTNETSELQQREIEFEMRNPSSGKTWNKIMYVILTMLLPLNCLGIDRCCMGECFLGLMKGFSLGGLGIWMLVDFIVCFYVALAETPTLDTIAYDLVFTPSTISPALWVSLVMFILQCCCGGSGAQKADQQRAATQQFHANLAANQQAAPDVPMHHHSLALIPTGLSRHLRKAGLVQEKPTVPELIKVFNQMDKDGNGQLDHDELKDALQALGVDTAEMDAVIKEADADGDGQLSLPEFLLAMSKQGAQAPHITPQAPNTTPEMPAAPNTTSEAVTTTLEAPNTTPAEPNTTPAAPNTTPEATKPT